MVKKNVWITALLMFVLLTAAFLFIGCELDASRTDLADSASRSLRSPGRPTSFTAVVFVQQENGYTTEPMGSSDRWRTTDEVLVGEILATDWEVLEQKQIVMSNFTNFHADDYFQVEGEPIPYGNVSGTNHSSIEIKDGDSLVMTMRANGKLAGFIPVAAVLDMSFTTTGNGPNARGELSGQFIWAVQPDEMAPLLTILEKYALSPDKPFGIFELTGVYQ